MGSGEILEWTINFFQDDGGRNMPILCNKVGVVDVYTATNDIVVWSLSAIVPGNPKVFASMGNCSVSLELICLPVSGA
tara:strand:+ start:3349 stop:3582 length:234 start_codon:yes stop_codon:yes gene_type:complete